MYWVYWKFWTPIKALNIRVGQAAVRNFLQPSSTVGANEKPNIWFQGCEQWSETYSPERAPKTYGPRYLKLTVYFSTGWAPPCGPGFDQRLPWGGPFHPKHWHPSPGHQNQPVQRVAVIHPTDIPSMLSRCVDDRELCRMIDEEDDDIVVSAFLTLLGCEGFWPSKPLSVLGPPKEVWYHLELHKSIESYLIPAQVIVFRWVRAQIRPRKEKYDLFCIVFICLAYRI